MNVDEEIIWDEYRQGQISWDELYDIITGELTEKGNIVKKIKQEILDKYRVLKYNKNDEIIAVNCPRLAQCILQEFYYNFITVRDNKEIYYYEDGYYHPDGETIIQHIAEDLLDELCTTHRKNEVVGYIRDLNFIDRGCFDERLNLLNLENGVYNIKTNELISHSPDYLFLSKIPVVYDPDAKCPKILKFLNEVVYKHDIPVIQEFFGYCFYRKYHIHKACMFLGEGKNGKSTTIRLLDKLLGKYNISNKSLQSIVYDKFASSSLYGKLANITADLSPRAIKQTGMFKMLTGEDQIDAEKKFRDSFSFTNYAKFLFSANTLPKADDQSYAYYRRWLLISFPNTFEGEKCNPNIFDEISDEIPGLFNWSIKGLKRLLKNGDFSYNKTVEEVMEQYRTMSDPIYAYVQEFIEQKSGTSIIKQELWGHYTKWCKKKKLPITPRNMLTQRLNEHLPEMKIGKVGPKGKNKPAYLNIAWKNPVTVSIGVEEQRLPC